MPSRRRWQKCTTPPGRGSIRQNGSVTSRGPNHRAKCSASVQTLKRISRGASMTREKFTSVASAVRMVSFAMLASFVGQRFYVGLQAVEPLLPDHALAADPVLDGRERDRLQMTGAHTADLFGPDQPARFQNLKMLQDRRQRHGQRLGQLADGGGATAEPLHDGPPGRVRQGMKHTVERGTIVSHRTNYIGSADAVN